jgi:hypothetical protein
MVIFHKVNLDLTNNQIKNLINKKAINLKHGQLGNGIHLVHVNDSTLKKMDKTNKLKKGFRLKLNEDEHNETMQDGEGIVSFFRKFGKKLRPLKSIATNAIGTKIAQEIFNPLTENIALESGASIKNIMNNISMPFQKGSASAKEHMAKIRAMKKNKGEDGEGLFKTLSKFGISRGKIERGLKKGIKDVAHNGINLGTSALTTALTTATGNPSLAKDISNTLGNSVHAIADGKNPITSIKNDIRTIGRDALNTINHPDSESGGKIRRQRKNKGCGIDAISPMYTQAMAYNYGIHPMAGGGIHSPHGQIIMANPYATYSPYQNTNSPAMSPYIPTYSNFSPYLAYQHYNGRGLF